MIRRIYTLIRSLVVTSGFAGLVLLLPVSSLVSANDAISFKNDVFPVIQIKCLACHKPGGAGYEKSGLDLRSYVGLMKGTKFGSIVTPGDAFLSNLNVLIEGRASKSIRMPFKSKKLNPCDQKMFRRWVDQGAKDN